MTSKESRSIYIRVFHYLLSGRAGIKFLDDSAALPLFSSLASLAWPMAYFLDVEPSSAMGMTCLALTVAYYVLLAYGGVRIFAQLTPDKTAIRSDRYDPAQWSAVRRWTATEDPSMGAWLRRMRLKRGKRLDVIAEITSISKRNLEAIEQDRFEALPNGPQRKSWLRQYADEIGLDPARVIVLFDDYVTGGRSAVVVAPVMTLRTAATATSTAPGRDRTTSGPPRSHRCARAVFDALERVLDQRIAREEFGDALEYILGLPRGSSRVWLTIAWTVLRTSFNAIRESPSAPWGRRTGR
jgi:hypothetical protein